MYEIDSPGRVESARRLNVTPPTVPVRVSVNVPLSKFSPDEMILNEPVNASERLPPTLVNVPGTLVALKFNTAGMATLVPSKVPTNIGTLTELSVSEPAVLVSVIVLAPVCWP